MSCKDYNFCVLTQREENKRTNSIQDRVAKGVAQDVPETPVRASLVECATSLRRDDRFLRVIMKPLDCGF